jgi:hypothetical protein
MRFDPEREEETELLARTVPPYPYGLSMSPDGRHLALGLYSQGDPASTLELISESGESLKLPGAWGPPLWLRDSHRFLYFAGNDVWSASVEGAQPRHIGTIEVPSGMEISAGSVHPDGTHLAVIAAEPFRYELWRIQTPDR